MSADASGEGSTAGPGAEPDRDGEPDRDDERPVAYDVLFELLSNRRRRFMIHYLKQRPTERVEMGEVSTQVAAWERGVDPESLTYDQRKTVHTSLYQYHAPKLADAGVVDYDATRGTVRLTERGRDTDLYVEAVTGRDASWATYFLGLSTVAVGLSLTGWLDVGPLSAIAGGPVGIAVSVGFLVSAALFAYDSRTRLRLGADGPPPGAGDDGGEPPE
jgi:hypothetical protein